MPVSFFVRHGAQTNPGCCIDLKMQNADKKGTEQDAQYEQSGPDGNVIDSDSVCCSQAVLTEAMTKLDAVTSEANKIRSEMDAATPVHKRDLLFLASIHRSIQSAKKAWQQMLKSSSSLGQELSKAYEAFQAQIMAAQVSLLPKHHAVNLLVNAAITVE